MPSFVGNNKFKAFFGGSSIKGIYAGANKVYPNSFLSISNSAFSFAVTGQTHTLNISVNDGQAWQIVKVNGSNITFSKITGTGPGSVDITIPNNQGVGNINSTYKVVSEDLEQSFTMSQPNGSKVYGNWSNYGITLGTTSFAATGGSTSMTINVERYWTWNGVGSSYRETSTSNPISVQVGSKTGGSISGTTLTVNNLTTTQTDAYSFDISALSSYDGSKRVSITASQAKNVVDHYEYGAWQVKLNASGSDLPASGGTITLTKSASRSVTQVLTTGSKIAGSDESATPTIITTRSSSLFTVSQTGVSANSRYQTSGGYDYVKVVAEYSGVRSSEISIGIAANYPNCTFTCSGYTKNTTCTWPSGAPNTKSSETNSEDCGYGFTLSWALEQSTYINSVGNGGTMYSNLRYGKTQSSLDLEWNETINSTTKLSLEKFIGKNIYFTGGWSPVRYNNCVLYTGTPNWTRLNQTGSIISFRIDESADQLVRALKDVSINCIADISANINCGDF